MKIRGTDGVGIKFAADEAAGSHRITGRVSPAI